MAIGRELFRVDTFSEFMENVKEVKILKRHLNYQISSWKINVDGVELNWVEEERLSLEKGEMAFRLIQGDFERFEGKWLFSPIKNRKIKTPQNQIFLQLVIDYDLGLGSFEELIGEVFLQQLEKNTQNLLSGMKKHSEGMWQ